MNPTITLTLTYREAMALISAAELARAAIREEPWAKHRSKTLSFIDELIEGKEKLEIAQYNLKHPSPETA